MTHCKICNQESKKLFSKRILNKYNADYFKCSNCGFVQTSEPVWLREAYTSAITSLDIGLIDRNILLKEQVADLIDRFFPEAYVMLDYGGGYGMFVRMMRDKGFNFYRQDIYCENLFAVNFDLDDAPIKKFDLLTSFEVFEHLTDPLQEIKRMLSYSDTIIFTTVLAPAKVEDLVNWWYLSTSTGQHIALYSKESLAIIAKKIEKNFYTNGQNIHIFTNKVLNEKEVNAVFYPAKPGLIKRALNKLFFAGTVTKRRTSLIRSDYEYIESKLKKM